VGYIFESTTDQINYISAFLHLKWFSLHLHVLL